MSPALLLVDEVCARTAPQAVPRYPRAEGALEICGISDMVPDGIYVVVVADLQEVQLTC